MNNNILNQEFIPNKLQNVEHQKSSSNIQMSQNKLFENQIIKKLTSVEYVIDESIKKHGDKSLILIRKNNNRNEKCKNND